MRRGANRFPYAALLVLTLAAFLPVCANGFVDFDDEVYITKNPHVLNGWTGTDFRWAWTTFYGTYWQPLSWLSLQGDAQLFSSRAADGQVVPSAVAFHVHNLLWHAAGVLLLFAAWRRLTGAFWPSLLAAALFAVHPLRVESVAWAAERKDVLSCFFGILTLWAYAGYAERPGWGRMLGVAGAFLLSLLCKPMLMTLPFALLLLDYWPLGRMSFSPPPPAGPARPPVPLRRLVVEKLPLFALTLAAMGVTLLARRETVAGLSYAELPLFDRLATAAAAYGWYVRSTFWPLGLAAMYAHPLRDWSAAAALAGAATLLGVTLLACWQAKRRPWLLVGWLWFVGSLVPVLGLALNGDQAWADRFTYWPHVGLLAAVAWGLATTADRLRLPAAARAAAGALAVGALAALTWVQVGTWSDTVTLWERALAVTERNYRAHLGLGTYYELHGRLDVAETHFAACVRLRPRSPEYHYYHGGVLLKIGRVDEAAEQFQAAVALAPDFFAAWHNLGVSRLRQGRAAEAAASFRRVLELQPDADGARAWLGEALWREGKRDEAVAAWQAALGHDPTLAAAWHGLGLAFLAQGEPGKAAGALDRAVRLRPNVIGAYSDLGVALGRQGRWPDAVRLQLMAVRVQEKLDRDAAQFQGRPAADEGLLRLVTYYCRLGFAHWQCGQRSAAAQAYAAAGALDPHWPHKFAARARALAECRQDPRLAVELASQAVQAVAEPPPAFAEALAVARAALEPPAPRTP